LFDFVCLRARTGNAFDDLDSIVVDGEDDMEFTANPLLEKVRVYKYTYIYTHTYMLYVYRCYMYMYLVCMYTYMYGVHGVPSS
jgi:hypothetical protein